MECCWPMYYVTWYLHPYYDIENTGLYNSKYTWNQTGNNTSIKSSNTPTFGMYVSYKEFILIIRNAAMMCVMYIIKGVHRPEPRSSGGNTSSNPHVSALIPQPAFNGMERMCQRHGVNQNTHTPVLVQKPLCYQFIHYHISSRGVFGINHVNRWSMMITCSLQAEFMETKYNSHIYRYGTSIFGKIVVDISKSINNNNQIFLRL